MAGFGSNENRSCEETLIESDDLTVKDSTRPFGTRPEDLVDPNRKVMVKSCGCPTGNPSAAVRRAAPGYHYTRDHLLSL